MKFVPVFDPNFKPMSVVLRDYKNRVLKSDFKKLKI